MIKVQDYMRDGRLAHLALQNLDESANPRGVDAGGGRTGEFVREVRGEVAEPSLVGHTDHPAGTFGQVRAGPLCLVEDIAHLVGITKRLPVGCRPFVDRQMLEPSHRLPLERLRALPALMNFRFSRSVIRPVGLDKVAPRAKGDQFLPAQRRGQEDVDGDGDLRLDEHDATFVQTIGNRLHQIVSQKDELCADPFRLERMQKRLVFWGEVEGNLRQLGSQPLEQSERVRAHPEMILSYLNEGPGNPRRVGIGLALCYILRSYLQLLAFKILQGRLDALTYVDGFSGPWNSEAEDFSDTSFSIAINVLKDTQRRLQEMGRKPEIRCFFVERNAKSHAKLRSHVVAHHDPAGLFRVETFEGRFEDAIPKIMPFIERSFALTFIDPTGWKVNLAKCEPLLRHKPGEVLANFMFDHIQRFTASEAEKIVASFEGMLGGSGWKDRLTQLDGHGVEKLFLKTLRETGNFQYVLSTHIKKLADRPHFSIGYSTRSPDGLKTFREVEYKALLEHDRERAKARQERRAEKTGHADMFGGVAESHMIDAIVGREAIRAKRELTDLLRKHGTPVAFQRVWTSVLLDCMLRVTDVKDICCELADEGVIKPSWKKGRRRKPDDEDLIEAK